MDTEVDDHEDIDQPNKGSKGQRRRRCQPHAWSVESEEEERGHQQRRNGEDQRYPEAHTTGEGSARQERLPELRAARPVGFQQEMQPYEKEGESWHVGLGCLRII